MYVYHVTWTNPKIEDILIPLYLLFYDIAEPLTIKVQLSDQKANNYYSLNTRDITTAWPSLREAP